MTKLIEAGTPKHPIVLAHGLLGFDELHLAGSRLPGIHYWRGIAEAMRKNGIEVITTHALLSQITSLNGSDVSRLWTSDRGRVLTPSTATTLPRLYQALKSIHIQTGAFSQLTRQYMEEEFNPKTPDREGVRYFSYGATAFPAIWSAFRRPHGIVSEQEGPNDGLVSVASSKWGDYKGTLFD
ncbi:MAG: hypothetical protein Q9218_006497, partial [Villophora microphyllina]